MHFHSIPPDEVESLVDLFCEHFASLEPDLLSPEILIWNTKDLTTFWKYLQEHHSLIADDIPYWAAVWPGGRALARYVLDHPDLVRGRRVLDLGTGSGIVALAAAMAGGEVVGYDVDPHATALARRGAEENGVAARFLTGDILDSNPDPDIDVILAGDIFYDRMFARRSMAWLRRYAKGNRVVLVADPGRSHRPTEGVRPTGRLSVPVYREIENISKRDTELLFVTDEK